MSSCTFFGHRDCPEVIKSKLKTTIVDLIEHQGVDMFYVGNHGTFDALVRAALIELIPQYPSVQYAVVLAYMPQEKVCGDCYETIFPEGIETVPRRFAINWRNKWMLRQSDFVVTYVTHSWGGAARFTEMARKRKKIVINLVDQ